MCECLNECNLSEELFENKYLKIKVKTNYDEIGIIEQNAKKCYQLCEIYSDTNMPDIRYNTMGGRPSIDVEINKNKYDCMLDTGAKISVLEYELLKCMGRYKLYETETDIRCANDSQIEIVGKSILTMNIGYIYHEIEFFYN